MEAAHGLDRVRPVSDVVTARRRLKALRASLETLIARDPEQEVTGSALPVVDAVLSDVRAALVEDPVASTVREIISIENAVSDGEPTRVADLLIIVDQLLAALPPEVKVASASATVGRIPGMPRRSIP